MRGAPPGARARGAALLCLQHLGVAAAPVAAAEAAALLCLQRVGVAAAPAAPAAAVEAAGAPPREPLGGASAPGPGLAGPLGEPGIPPDDSRNVPSDEWPGPDALASQGMWAAGQQPQNLASWPHGGDGSLGGCWKTSVLLDTQRDWPGQCMGLDHSDEGTVEECQSACFGNPLCPVWQFSDLYGCWQGRGVGCTTRNGHKPVEELRRGQRIMHGQVRVLVTLRGIQIWDLRNVAVWRANDTDGGVEHCRKYCYSDLNCQYWQYGEGGCWVEDPDRPVQYPLTLDGGASRDTAFAKTVIAGEYIQHYCPRDPEPFSLPTSGAAGELAGGRRGLWRHLPWLLFAALVLVLAACIGCCAWDSQRARGRHLLYEVYTGYDSDPDLSDAAKDLDPEELADGTDWEAAGHVFTVKVNRSAGTQVGLVLDFTDGKTLLVTKIRPDSLLSAWNTANPDRRVRRGDRIVSANGLSGNVKALMDEMKTRQLLVLTVVREYDAPDSAPGSARNGGYEDPGQLVPPRPRWGPLAPGRDGPSPASAQGSSLLPPGASAGAAPLPGAQARQGSRPGWQQTAAHGGAAASLPPPHGGGGVRRGPSGTWPPPRPVPALRPLGHGYR